MAKGKGEKPDNKAKGKGEKPDIPIITTRRNTVFKERIGQILFNRACADGGRPYIDMRLWRAPNETDKQWNGDPEDGTVGRKTRTV